MGTRKLKRPEASPSEKPSAPGRVVFDSRGNPVWQWNTDAGDSTSVLLKQLENEDLALEPTRTLRSIGDRDWPERHDKRPASGGRTTSKATQEKSLEHDEPDAGKGFDPYNRS
ncbi:MAG TPA: hypothetical protein VF339_19310 [Gammaproteobacteria bacterium]